MAVKELHTITVSKSVYTRVVDSFQKAYGVKPQIGDFVEKALLEKIEKIENTASKRKSAK